MSNHTKNTFYQTTYSSVESLSVLDMTAKKCDRIYLQLDRTFNLLFEHPIMDGGCGSTVYSRTALNNGRLLFYSLLLHAVAHCTNSVFTLEIVGAVSSSWFIHIYFPVASLCVLNL